MNIEKDINKLLSNLKNGKPLRRPKKILRMAEKVAFEIPKRKKENIEEWAEKLAEDLSKI